MWCALACSGQTRAECTGEAVDLLGRLHLQPPAVGGDRRNEIVHKGRSELPLKGVGALSFEICSA